MRGFRVGIVNPKAPFGERVRELLHDQHLPVIELKLFESEIDGEATLAQFHDEVVVTQPIDADLFLRLDALFFAGNDSDLMNRLASDAAADGVLTFVEGALGLDAPVMEPGLGDDDLQSERLIAVPRMASHLVGATLHRANEAFSIASAAATVLLPAGEQGSLGADELHQQVVHLLNFKSPPTEIFGEQIAFNATIPGSGPRAAALAQTVASEASTLSGVEAVTVALIRVPVFHGYGASIWIEPEKAVEERTIQAAFNEAPFLIETGRGARAPSPVGAAESNRIHVGGIRRPAELSTAGFWLWAVADTTAYDPALAAVELAKNALA